MPDKKPLISLCTIAVILSLIIAAFILIIVVGSALNANLSPFTKLNLKESLMMLVLIAIFLSLVFSWWKPFTTGLIIILGLICFYLLDYLFTSNFPRGPYFIITALPGDLLILCSQHRLSTTT